jgi:hypothetical protein
MYPDALTKAEFKEENSPLNKLLIAYQHIKYSKPKDYYLVKKFINFETDPKLDLFVENLSLRLDELEGIDSEQILWALKDLWIETHIETEIEFSYLQKPKSTSNNDLPW